MKLTQNSSELRTTTVYNMIRLEVCNWVFSGATQQKLLNLSERQM